MFGVHSMTLYNILKNSHLNYNYTNIYLSISEEFDFLIINYQICKS